MRKIALMLALVGVLGLQTGCNLLSGEDKSTEPKEEMADDKEADDKADDKAEGDDKE